MGSRGGDPLHAVRPGKRGRKKTRQALGAAGTGRDAGVPASPARHQAPASQRRGKGFSSTSPRSFSFLLRGQGACAPVQCRRSASAARPITRRWPIRSLIWRLARCADPESSQRRFPEYLSVAWPIPGQRRPPAGHEMCAAIIMYMRPRQVPSCRDAA